MEKGKILNLLEKKMEKENIPIDLNDQKSISLSTYEIIDGDIIIVDPTFNKVKSAGFIKPSINCVNLVSDLGITLLLINN